MSEVEIRYPGEPAGAGLLAVGGLVRDIMAVAELLERATADLLVPEGVNPGQRALLVCLRHLGPQTMAQAARNLKVSRQHVRVLVHPLVGRGLLAWRENPQHKRSALVELTPRGQDVVRRILGREGCELERLAAELENSEVKQACRVLGKLGAAISPG